MVEYQGSDTSSSTPEGLIKRLEIFAGLPERIAGLTTCLGTISKQADFFLELFAVDVNTAASIVLYQ